MMLIIQYANTKRCLLLMEIESKNAFGNVHTIGNGEVLLSGVLVQNSKKSTQLTKVAQ